MKQIGQTTSATNLTTTITTAGSNPVEISFEDKFVIRNYRLHIRIFLQTKIFSPEELFVFAKNEPSET
jgi:hypothetical protein